MFAIRHELLQLLGNDLAAYAIAMVFVADNADKLTVFKVALQESRQSGTIEDQSATAVKISETRWLALSPPEVKK